MHTHTHTRTCTHIFFESTHTHTSDIDVNNLSPKYPLFLILINVVSINCWPTTKDIYLPLPFKTILCHVRPTTNIILELSNNFLNDFHIYWSLSTTAIIFNCFSYSLWSFSFYLSYLQTPIPFMPPPSTI